MKHSHGHWQRSEEHKAELASVMVHLAETLRRIAVLLQPFLTRTPNEIFRAIRHYRMNHSKHGMVLEQFGMIPSGTKVEKGANFPKA